MNLLHYSNNSGSREYVILTDLPVTAELIDENRQKPEDDFCGCFTVEALPKAQRFHGSLGSLPTEHILSKH